MKANRIFLVVLEVLKKKKVFLFYQNLCMSGYFGQLVLASIEAIYARPAHVHQSVFYCAVHIFPQGQKTFPVSAQTWLE